MGKQIKTSQEETIQYSLPILCQKFDNKSVRHHIDPLSMKKVKVLRFVMWILTNNKEKNFYTISNASRSSLAMMWALEICYLMLHCIEPFFF